MSEQPKEGKRRLVLPPVLPGYESDGNNYDPYPGEDGKIYKKCDQCNKRKLYDEFADNQNSTAKAIKIYDENGYTGEYSKKRKTCNECRRPNGNKNSIAAESVWRKHNIPDPTEKTCCEICKKTYEQNKSKKMVRDHCHERNIPRGYLCNECNTAIGKLGDSIETVKYALRYLESVEGDKWKEKFGKQENELI
jgi:hypothetical protein